MRLSNAPEISEAIMQASVAIESDVQHDAQIATGKSDGDVPEFCWFLVRGDEVMLLLPRCGELVAECRVARDVIVNDVGALVAWYLLAILLESSAPHSPT